MLDEFIDIAFHKHLTLCGRYINSESNSKDAFKCDPLVNDTRVESITEKI